MTLLLASSYYSKGQFLHTQEELEEIVINNPNKYLLQETETLSQESFENCRTGIENHNVQDAKGSSPSNLTQVVSNATRKKLKKKNKHILKKVNQSKGQKDLISEMCANHFRLGNFDEALYYKLQLLEKGEATFEDEYILARSYFEIKNYDQALVHAFNAKVMLPYQQNNASPTEQDLIENLLSETLSAKKRPYNDWTLNFSYCITNRDNKTYISYKSEPWKSYAICKSVWAEETEHSKKMSTISDQSAWLVEEKECLLNTLIAFMRYEADNPEFKGLNHLAKALDENTVKEFILYEKFIAKYQAIPEGMPSKEDIKKLRSYFLSAHSTGL